MKLIDISKGNIRRRPGRATAVVIGLMIAVMAMTALFSMTTGLAKTVAQEMEAAGTKVLILPNAEKVSFSYGGIAVAAGVTYNFQPLPLDAVEKINKTVSNTEIVAMSPVTLSALTIAGTKYLTVSQEFNNIAKLKPWWKILGSYPKDANNVVLGSSIAKKLNAYVGIKISTDQGEYTVSGILQETGAQDDGLIFTLNKAGNAPSLVEILLKDNENFTTEVSKLQQGLPFAKVTAVRDATEAKKQALEQYRRFSLVIALIMALVAVLIVTTGFSAAAAERVKEVGIFRAMGFQVKHIIKIFLYEALILAGIGSIAGMVIGQAIALAFAPKIGGGVAAFLPWYAYAGVLGGSLLLSGVAAYLPAKKASMIDPAEALRYL